MNLTVSEWMLLILLAFTVYNTVLSTLWFIQTMKPKTWWFIGSRRR